MKASDGRRVQRYEKEVQELIATFLIYGFRENLPVMVNVSRVQMPADLKSAKIYITFVGDEKHKEEVVKTLQKNAFQFQGYLAKEMKARYCPKLTFFYDEGYENYIKVEKILHNLELERTKKTKEDEVKEEENHES